MSNNNTQKLTIIAMLSAISFVLSYFQFPLLPMVDFLKVEFTVLPILIGLFMFGLGSAMVILIIRTILWVIINPGGVPIYTYIGLPMNFVAVAVFVFILWLFLRNRFKISHYILATIAGIFALTVVMVLLNYVYAIPVFSKFAGYNIATMFPGGVSKYIIAVALFNLLQGLIYSVSFALLYWALRGSKVIKFKNQ
ncbi:MAG: ECF transporter S component [Streptococcaceae bacterium]|jgi:riboflavin transporter FmnP|nr:ECF transporter S component [Streptococcaceae bacterium]MCL2681243.1 ECF transporter S component [Streptococcaceae bacterium]